MSANGATELDERETGGAYSWMTPETTTVPVSVTTQATGEAHASGIIPFSPPDMEPFAPSKLAQSWHRSRRFLTYISGTLLVLAANLCLLHFLPLGPAEMKWTALVLSILTSATALLSITTLVVINYRVKEREVERRENAVALYLEQTGWTRVDEYRPWPIYVKDFGLERGFLRVEYYSDKVEITGECDEQALLQLKENLLKINPDLPFEDYESSPFDHPKLIDFSKPPAEDTRIEELGYGQSGWIGEKAVYDKRGDPSYSANITAKIRRGAFVRQARSETHNVLVITCKRNQARFAEARAKALERVRKEGAPAGTTVAVIYDWIYEFQIAAIEKFMR